jgi:hypothetical protein
MARTLQVESINSSSTGLDLQTLGASRLFINNSGYVGIGLGAVSPLSPLHIGFSNTALPTTGGGSIIQLTNTDTTTSSTSSILFTGYDAGGTNRHGAAISWIKTGSWTSGGNNYGSALIFSTRADAGNTVEYVRITSSGNVGIKNSTPSSYNAAATDLVIGSGSSNSGITIASSTTGLGSIHFADGTSGDTAYRGLIKYEHTTDNLQLFTAATERLRIDSSGNVGIGTTASPEAKLHLYGAGTTSRFYTNGDADAQALYLQSSGGAAGDGGQILFGASQGAFAGIKGHVDNGTGPAGTLIFQTRTTSGNILERMSIDSSGQVGIGASPIDQLTIGGTGRINFGGSVITDTTAGIYFHTAGSTSYAIHRTAGAWTASTYQQLRMGFETGIVLDGGTGHDKSFVRVDGTGIRVATGNIGIGTTTKALSYKLDVYGTSYSDCFRIASSGASSGIDFFDTSSGSLARKGIIYTNSEGIGILNSAASWALRVNQGTTNVVIPTGSLAVGQDIITNANYGYGHVGVYESTRFQSVFAMGTPYTMKADGTSLSAGAGGNNFYGIAWSHPNVGGQGANLNNHGALFVVNGVTQTAISSQIWCNGNITAYSDERVKTNWRNFDNNFIEKLAKVKSGIFDRTDVSEKENGFKTQVGVSAQSLKEVIPDAVTCNSEGMLSVSYGNAAMASCVELAKEILKLKEEIAKIKENK